MNAGWALVSILGMLAAPQALPATASAVPGANADAASLQREEDADFETDMGAS